MAPSLVRNAYDRSHGPEVVEDDATVELLRALDVDFAQGFHIGRPQPLGEAIAAAPPRAAEPTDAADRG